MVAAATEDDAVMVMETRWPSPGSTASPKGVFGGLTMVPAMVTCRGVGAVEVCRRPSWPVEDGGAGEKVMHERGARCQWLDLTP